MIVYAEDITPFNVQNDLLESYAAFSLKALVFLWIPFVVIHPKSVSHCVHYGNRHLIIR